MSNTKFTEGPWVFDKYRNLNDQNGEPIKTTGTSIPCGHSQEETAANMNLIAAAPKMYEMLVVLSGLLTDTNNHLLCNEVENLLAKARGEHE